MLSSIPHEILVLIIQQFDFHDDALNLARCCRQFYDLLHPHIFTTIQFRDNCLWELSRLVHFIIQSPRHAANVRRLLLKSEYPCQRHDSKKLKYDSATILPALQTICCSKDEQNHWYQDLKRGTEDASPWAALLMAHLPRLRCLKTEFGRPSALHIPHTLDRASRRQKPFDVHPPFNSLQEAWVYHWDTKYGIDFTKVIPFFRLPEMRRFYGVQIIADDEEEKYNSLLSSGTSEITDITLINSNCGSSLRVFMRACARLESFNYFHADGGIGDTSFDPQAFYPSLYDHKDSLRRLTLLYEDGHYAMGDDSEDCFLGSLAEFSVLKDIYIRPSNIFCWEDEENKMPKLSLIEVLPASLETLYLEDTFELDLELLVEHLEALVRNKKTNFPCLSTLAIAEQQFPVYPKIDIPNMLPQNTILLRILNVLTTNK